HFPDKSIALSIGVSNVQKLSSKFTFTLRESGGMVDLSFNKASLVKDAKIAGWPLSLSMDIAVPYEGIQQMDDVFELTPRLPAHSEEGETDIDHEPVSGTLHWNGITLSARVTSNPAAYSDDVAHINERANLPLELARRTGFVPLRRGFSKPTYNLANVTPTLNSEDEVASLLASYPERFGQYEISRFVEKVANRRIQTQGQIGTSTFSIDSIPTGKEVPASIVNEGFGINQLVYMLTICLYSRYKIVAIEEPEIHLHPSMVRELAIALAEIAVEKDRRLIVSTHSETFVVALLSQIAAGKISIDDVSFVLAENPNGSTVLDPQKANRSGQIEGGLRAFMASGAKDLVDFLGLSSE
ncbi:MAG: AAA family ATPase, partial [Chloroflexi bacterium]|nr:AAA family ATPase [Chloroflexota bacterium]